MTLCRAPSEQRRACPLKAQSWRRETTVDQKPSIVPNGCRHEASQTRVLQKMVVVRSQEAAYQQAQEMHSLHKKACSQAFLNAGFISCLQSTNFLVILKLLKCLFMKCNYTTWCKDFVYSHKSSCMLLTHQMMSIYSKGQLELLCIWLADQG